MLARLRSAFPDLAPLRRREFRLLYAGQLVSMAGSMITMVALPFQMYQLTGSSLAVGLIGLAEFVPMFGLALVSGALADAVDRRRLVIAADVGAGLVIALLAANAALDDPHVWVLFVGAFLAAGFYALLRPPLDGLVPRLVPREELKDALALEWIRGDVGQIAGPALGGVLIASFGLPATYLIDVGTFAVSLVMLAAMRPVPPPEDAERPSLRTIADGLRYARSRRDLLGTYLVDINAMFFGVPMALFPALAVGYGGAEILGLLFAAPAVGSVVFAATSGWTRRVHRHGAGVVLAASGWGVAIVGFGLVESLWPALAFLALAGGMDAISGMFRAFMWNESVPDHLRGRMAGIEMISYISGPTLGDTRAGIVASLAGPRFSIVSGGVACVAGCLVLALALPELWRYDARDFPSR